MKNKKGSHVGVVLSFAIFVMFLVFFYTAISPSLRSNQEKQNLLNYLEIELKEEMATELTELTIDLHYVSENINSDCIKLDSFIDEIGGIPVYIMAENETDYEYITNWSLTDNSVQITEPGNTGTFDVDSFKVYNSLMFPETEEFNGDLEEECVSFQIDHGDNRNYTLRYVWTEEFISEEAIESVIEEYSESYDELKEELGISESDEFGFEFIYQNEDSIKTQKRIPSSVNVYSKYIPLVYINEDLNQRFGYLRIFVW